VLLAVLIATHLGGAVASSWIADIGLVLAAAFATVQCARAARRHTGRLRRFWWLMASACAAWTAGEFLWAFYEIVLRRDVPVPSWPDVAYLAAIPLATVALLSHPAIAGSGARTIRSALDSLVLATALLFLSWTLVMGSLWRANDVSTIGGLVDLAYPFGDVVLVFIVIVVIRRMTGPGRTAVWCLLAGLLFTAFADSAYAYLVEVKAYGTGNLIDAAWVAGYLFIGLGAGVAPGGAPAGRVAVPAAPAPAAVVAPFVPMLTALSVAAFELETGHGLDTVALVSAFALVGLVLVRQALLGVEIARDRGRGEGHLTERLVSALEVRP
jgi:hypothetical protein